LESYNILQDKEFDKQGIMPLIKRVFAGEAMEITAHEYNKANVPEVLGQSGRLWVRTFLYPLLGEGGMVREIVLLMYSRLTGNLSTTLPWILVIANW
jgi:hypothetical protein